MRADELRTFWDSHTKRWLAGHDELSDPLERWWASYQGKGAGTPTRDCFAEPYVGPLDDTADLVTLGLNPGRAYRELQGRRGAFAMEIADVGDYSTWAAPNPYLGTTWESFAGQPNRYHQARQRFAEHWLGGPARVLTFELYPWHSTRVTAMMRPPADVAREFLWEPLADLDHELVFAFGKPWLSVCQPLELETGRTWTADSPVFKSSVASRVVRTFKHPAGGRVAVCWQSGYAGPPGPDDTRRLRELLG